MVRVNRLDGGARYLIESEADPSRSVIFTLAEVDALASAICHRLKTTHLASGGSGLVLRTMDRKELHVAFSDEVPGLLAWLQKEFPDHG